MKEFFSSIAVNSFENFPIGSMKHSIYCNDEGLIASQAILQRNDEQEYHFFAGFPWPHYQLALAEGGSTCRSTRRPRISSRSPGRRRWRRSSG